MIITYKAELRAEQTGTPMIVHFDFESVPGVSGDVVIRSVVLWCVDPETPDNPAKIDIVDSLSEEFLGWLRDHCIGALKTESAR